MYPNIRCIVTCRPHASLGMSLTADAEIRLKGFSKQQAQHYVDMYFIQKYPSNRKLAEQESSKLWNDIESSPDLLEMSVNPSMLQLLCKMFLATGKIAKDRANVFKDYTYFLLQQMHLKLHKKPVSHTELKNMYKGTLLKAGQLALHGLKQSHLQLIFTKESVIELAGKEMFDIGFVTEIPGHGFETPKAQFQHKTHQEYLAAYFIVKSSDDVGINYLMEFCSTSKGLMGSQIILTFITAMSKRMGNVIQRKITELVSSWASEDDISPKDRTSFLLTMLKENKTLSFPLPKEIDINVREYEKSSGWFQKMLQKFGKKSALEIFFSFENRGVEKIALVIGKEHRLELLKNFKNSQLKEVSVDFHRKFIEKDQVHLSGLIQRNEKLTFLSMEKLLVQDIVCICRNSEFIASLVKSNNLKTIRLPKCETDMNTELADAFKHFPNHVELDISGNRVKNQFVCKALIQNAAHLASLIMQDCSIMIDTETAEAISQLPVKANLDLSGNTVTKMDSSLLCHVIPVISNKKIDLSGLGVIIDAQLATVLCSIDKRVEVDLSGNKIAEMNYQLLCQLLHRLYWQTQVDVIKNETFIKTNLLQVIHMKEADSYFDISNNNQIKQDITLSLAVTADKWKHLFLQDDNEVITKDAKTLLSQQLQGHVQLDIQDIYVPQMRNPVLPIVTDCITNQAKVDLSHIQFTHNENITRALLGLPRSVELDICGHPIGDKESCIKLIKKAGTLIALRMQFCGIIIDTEIAEAISKLPKEANLDLSGNTVTKMDSSLLCHVIPVIRHKGMDLSGLGVVIDAEVSKAICSLDEDVNVDISDNVIAQMDYQLLCQLLYRIFRKTKVDIHTNGTIITSYLLQVIHMKTTDSYFDISCNDTVIQDIILSMILTADKWKPLFQQDNNEVTSNEGMAVLSQHLQDHVQLEIHDIYLPQMRNRILPIVTACMTDQEKVDLSQINFQEDENTDDAMLNLHKNMQLDLSNHKIAKKSTSLKLIKKAGTLAVLILQNCGIEINTEIAEAVSRLPDHTQLDLSGNQVTDKSACIKLIHKAASMKSLNICNCSIQIDTEMAEAVSRLPDHTQLDLSGNQVTDRYACITLLHKAATMISLNIHDCMSNCGIQIDTESAEAVSRLPDHTQLDLSGNQVTDQYACITLLHKAANMKSLNIHNCMANCGIQIDTEIAEAVSRLPDHTQLDLSGNQVTDRSVLLTLLHKAASMTLFGLCNCVSNCGIQIDTEIIEAVSKLPDHTQLDLSGNHLSIMEPDMFTRILTYMTKQEIIDIDEWGITVDKDIVRALFRLTYLHTLVINYDCCSNNNTLTTTAMAELPHAVRSTPFLRVFYLDDCDISNDLVVALTDSLYKQCPILEVLSLCNNHLLSGVWEVLKHIKLMMNLRWLYLCGNPCVMDEKQRDKVHTTLHRSNPGLNIFLSYRQ